MSQQFCLKWNSHMTNMMDVFKSLLSTESMVDCTLACDGLSLKAHKIVLSACSPFFQALFLENPCKHPIVILKDMKYTELKAIIEFMYHGEVNVGQDQLSALMKTAETLRVKGLAEVTNEKNSQSNASGDEPSHRSVPRTETPPPSKRRRRTRKRSLSDSNRSDDESNEPKVKQPMSPDIEELSGDHTMEATSGHFSSIQSQVPMQQMPSHSTNSFQRTNVAQDSPHVEEPTSADESEFGVEPAKLLEQTLTTDDLANARRGRSSAQSGMERRSRSTDHSSSLVPTSMPSDSYSSSMNQQLESPPDIKPELLDLDPPISPVPGPSHSADNSMMYDQSSVSSHPGTSFQDNSGALVPQDSSPQGAYPESIHGDVSKLEASQRTLQETLEALLNRQQQQKESETDFSIIKDVLEVLPLQNKDNLLSLEERLLLDEDAFKQMVKYLAQIGGTRLDQVTRKILRRVMSDEVAMLFSFLGVRGKMAFKPLKMYNVIWEAVKKSVKTVTEVELDNLIASWLRHAKGRYSKRNDK